MKHKKGSANVDPAVVPNILKPKVSSVLIRDSLPNVYC
jgi:hypothetical protein